MSTIHPCSCLRLDFTAIPGDADATFLGLGVCYFHVPGCRRLLCVSLKNCFTGGEAGRLLNGKGRAFMRRRPPTERQIMDDAVSTIGGLLPVDWTLAVEREPPGASRLRPDVVLRIMAPDGAQATFVGEAKREAAVRQIHEALEQLRPYLDRRRAPGRRATNLFACQLDRAGHGPLARISTVVTRCCFRRPPAQSTLRALDRGTPSCAFVGPAGLAQLGGRPELLDVYPSATNTAPATRLWELTKQALGAPLPV